MTGSNRRQAGCRPATLPTELTEYIAGPTGVEPVISSVTSWCPSHLNDGPKFHVAVGAVGSYDDSALATDRPCLCRNRPFYLLGYIVAVVGLEPTTYGL